MKDLFFKILNAVTRKILHQKVEEISKDKTNKAKKIHPWRKCPEGYYFVKTHTKKSKNDVDGIWHEHCAKNPSGKDILTSAEIEIIANNPDFIASMPRPTQNDMKIMGVNLDSQNKYDGPIAGWTKYWNEVLHNEIKDGEPLTPNIVKALIATESEFRPNSIGVNSKTKIVGEAQGITQLTKQTIKILKDHKGEIRNHFIELTDQDSFDPNKNISAAVRWLFYKRYLLKDRTKKTPTWYETLEEYKGITGDNSKTANKIRTKIKLYLDKLGPN